jgi:pseudouridine kinase
MDDLGAQETAVLDLIKANAFVGQQDIADTLGLARSTVAAHIASLTRKGYILGRGYMLPARNRRIVCIGGAVIDRKYSARAVFVPATSNPVDGFCSLGGVARNVAENLVRLGVETSLVSLIGADEPGREILGEMRRLGVDVSQMIVTDAAPTAEYIALLGPDQDLYVAAANMGIFDLFTPDSIDRVWPHLAAASWVFADCNLSAAALGHLLARKQGARFRLAIDAVSIPKVRRLGRDLTGLDLLFLNLDEASELLGIAFEPELAATEVAARALTERGTVAALVTLGAQGLGYAEVSGASGVFPAIAARPVDTTGAGDAMIAATLHRLLAGDPLPEAARVGALLAALTTETNSTVHPALSERFLADQRNRIPA